MTENKRDYKWLLWAAVIVAVSVAVIFATIFIEKAMENADTPTGGVRTGMAIVTTDASKNAEGDKNGTAGFDTTLVGVVIGEDGKITDCKIDAVSVAMEFNAKGELVTEAGAAFTTKKELKADYGMKKYSPIGKEWFEQIAALEQYVIGKTPSQVKNIALDDNGYPTGDDLRAGCTIGISDIVKALVSACDNATEMGASADDDLRIAIIAKVADSSKNAAADADGLAQAELSFAAVTVNGDKVTSCKIDQLDGKITLKADGTAQSAAFKTKKELKEDYGMKQYSPIGKEWYEQADAFEKFVSENYDNINMNEQGYTENSDLKAGCTINLYPFKGIVDKALANK